MSGHYQGKRLDSKRKLIETLVDEFAVMFSSVAGLHVLRANRSGC